MQTEEDLAGQLETAMADARESQLELISLKEELRLSKQSAEEKTEEINLMQAKMKTVEVEYSNRLNDAHVRLKELTKDTVRNQEEKSC